MWLRRKWILAQTKTKEHFNVQKYIRDSLVLTLDYRMNILKLYRCCCKISLLKDKSDKGWKWSFTAFHAPYPVWCLTFSEDHSKHWVGFKHLKRDARTRTDWLLKYLNYQFSDFNEIHRFSFSKDVIQILEVRFIDH